ncbi:condensation domain-containing protein [Streptomyces sp. YU58]|uniref:condensation domain-containing protein n=1 Tax=Streptomyces sp. SX92 TaxID=3158972 RepID=UPI0027BAE82B|nr:condensation domain-containing protein [Streptomyces coralus]WLW54349.1 condensation domain-containing protein [Streptomyces coralus]
MDDIERISRCVSAIDSAFTPDDPGERTHGELMRSQEYYWFFYYAVPECKGILISDVFPVPDGATVQAVEAAVDHLVRRHEALRTTYPLGPHGRPVQHVLEPYRAPILTREDRAGEGVEEVTALLTREPIDPAVDQPVRFGLVTADGVPTWLVLAFSHLTLDAGSCHLLRDEFSARISHPERPEQAVGRQPLAQAAFEKTDKQDRQHTAVMKYWNKCLTDMPNMTFPSYRKDLNAVGPDEGSTAFTAATLTHPGISAAAESVAKAHRISGSAVFLSAYAIVLSMVSGQRSFASYITSSNRFDPAVSSSMGCFFQSSVLVMESSPEETVGDLLRKSSRAILMSMRNGRYSYWSAREEMARKADERGMMLRIGAHYNYVVLPESEKEEQSPDSPVEEETGPVLEWEEDVDWEDYDTDVYFRVHPTKDEIFLLAHDLVLQRHEIERTLRSTVELVALLAESPELADMDLATLKTRLDISPRSLPAGWEFIDNSWINVSELADVLRSIPQVDAASVSLVTNESGELEAHLASTDPAVGPSFLRHHLLGLLPGRPNIMVPQKFLVYDKVSGALHQEGDGRDIADTLPGTPEEHVLFAAIERFNPGITRSVSRSYVLCGGSAGVTTAIVGELGRNGYAGIIPDDLLAPQPISAIAAKLRKNDLVNVTVAALD